VTDTPNKPLIDYTVDPSPFEKVKRPVGNKAATKPSKPLPTWKDGQISGFATSTYNTIAGIIESVDPGFSAALKDIAEPAGKAWEKLAKQHVSVRRLFMFLMSGSTMTEVVMVHMPLFAYLATRYGPFRITNDALGDEFMENLHGVLNGDGVE
jgi:hypothetical protein